jgi:membrane protein DedA with SNARE-associated domain
MSSDPVRDAAFTLAARRHRTALIVGIVCVLAAATAAGFLIPRENFRELGQYGYAGVFVATLLGTLPIFVPVPYFVAIFMAGRFLDPLSVALVAGVAVVLGELVGYAAGYVGKGFIPDTAWVHRIERVMVWWCS